ncbi:DUF302 domain-containing protein [Sulfurimonas sp. HSL-1716]|uniref:DUF302 domain-containing protein n=1 Tax=Hydrocurvibacter sulfurireducens TaxID=3131937 RepID=UPI0031F8C66E
MKKLILLTVFTLSLFAGDMIVKNSICSVDDTVSVIKSMAKNEGMKIFAVIDHSADAEKIGMRLNESKMVILGDSKMGSTLMKQDITAGLDLPIRILVYKNSSGVVKIAYRDGNWLVSEHAFHASKTVRKMNDVLENITNKAGQCKKD